MKQVQVVCALLCTGRLGVRVPWFPCLVGLYGEYRSRVFNLFSRFSIV